MEARHTAPLRSRLNKCFSHTLTSSPNLQFGPPTGIISGSLCGQLWFTGTLCPSGSGKTLREKEDARNGGSYRALRELPHRDAFLPGPGIKVNREGPGKAQQSGYYVEYT